MKQTVHKYSFQSSITCKIDLKISETSLLAASASCLIISSVVYMFIQRLLSWL